MMVGGCGNLSTARAIHLAAVASLTASAIHVLSTVLGADIEKLFKWRLMIAVGLRGRHALKSPNGRATAKEVEHKQCRPSRKEPARRAGVTMR